MKWSKSANLPGVFPDPASGLGFKASYDGTVIIPFVIPERNVPLDLQICTKATSKFRLTNFPCCRLYKYNAGHKVAHLKVHFPIEIDTIIDNSIYLVMLI